MQVIAYDPYLDGRSMRARGADKVELDELLRRADFVSINCPLDADHPQHDRRARIRADAAARLFHHHGARLRSTTRRRWRRRCATKEIAGAGLDVWEKEPPPPDHPLLQFDNVMVSPHTAGVTREARANMGKIAAEQLLDRARRQAPAAHRQSAGVAGLRQALRAHVRLHAERAAERAELACIRESTRDLVAWPLWA